MRKPFFILVIILLTLNGYTQPLVLEWQNCFGGSKDDKAYDITRIGDGYLITGFTMIKHNSDIYHNDVLLIKVNGDGSLVWEKNIGGSLGDGAYRIFTTDKDNYVMVGATGSSDGDISYDPYPGTLDYWIVEINPDGDIIRENLYGGNCN